MKRFLVGSLACFLFIGLIGLTGCGSEGKQGAQGIPGKSAHELWYDEYGCGDCGGESCCNIDAFFDWLAERANSTELGDCCLEAPENLKIVVVGRLMTVTWDAVSNASGYIIITESAGCGSGNRIVNTATKSVTNLTGAETFSETNNIPVIDKGNGYVTFISDTSFTIWLMPATDSTTEAMATSLTAKIMAVGKVAGDNEYFDSNYSPVVTILKENYSPAAD